MELFREWEHHKNERQTFVFLKIITTLIYLLVRKYPIMVQYCGQCGTEIPDDPSFKFCENCGYPVAKETLTRLPSAAPGKNALPPPDAQVKKDPSKNRLLQIIGVWVFVVICLALISSFNSGGIPQVIVTNPFVTTSYTYPPVTQSFSSATYASSPSKISPVTFTGTYDGFFMYDNNPIQFPFTISMQQSGSKLSGTIREQSMVPGTASGVSDSSLQGTVSGNSVTFVKTYTSDNHQVTYSGSYDPVTMTINGRWNTQGMTGSFAIYLY
jgi:hypothetical protein